MQDRLIKFWQVKKIAILIVIGGIIFTLCLLKIGTAIGNDTKYIPVLVGLLVSFSSLSGVWITNYFNNKNHYDKQKFETNQKEQERIHLLRKDIYLNAHDEIIKLSSTIGCLVNPEGKIEKAQQDFENFLINMHRLRLTANVETSRSAGLVILKYVELYFDILTDAWDVIENDNNIKLNQEYNDKISKDIDRTLELMRLNFESDDINAEKQKKLELSFESLMDRRSEYSDRILELHNNKTNLVKNLSEKVAIKVQSVQPQVVDLTVLLRKDIFGDNDSREFLETLKEEGIESQEFIGSLFNKMISK